MTQEEKHLVLKDLCARLPYEVKIKDFNQPPVLRIGVLLAVGNLRGTEPDVSYYPIHGTLKDETYANISHICPYLRPMSSMTEEEVKEFRAFHCVDEWHPEFYQIMCNLPNINNMVNWLDKKMFDHRGLIPMGLALEAPKDMYSI